MTSRRQRAVGLLVAVGPALLALTGLEDLALTTLIGVGPFAFAFWRRLLEPGLSGRRLLGGTALVLLIGLSLVFAEYWMTNRAQRVDVSQLLGLAAAAGLGMGAAAAGGVSGRWVATRRAAGSTAAESDACGEECPTCGVCYDAGTGRCSADGCPLATLSVPRFLATRYRLEHRVGRGGMATVYVAFDTLLDRRVAAKIGRDDAVRRPGATERFQDEARAAASFSHPNVVTVFDYGVSRAQPFLVMELLNGPTLREVLLAEGRLAPPRALALLRDVGAAVDAAHQRQLIHRDLKPENIGLVAHGAGERAKVLDFGLAELLTQPGHELATGGAVVGTPLYMAPEQLRGEEPHPSWDLWALAIIAYEILHGTHPFSAVLDHSDPPPTSEVPAASVSEANAGFFARALAIDRARRPSSAGQFCAELERSLRG